MGLMRATWNACGAVCPTRKPDCAGDSAHLAPGGAVRRVAGGLSFHRRGDLVCHGDDPKRGPRMPGGWGRTSLLDLWAGAACAVPASFCAGVRHG